MDTFDVTADSSVEESEIAEVLRVLADEPIHRVTMDGESVDVTEMHSAGDTMTFVTDPTDRYPDEVTVYADRTFVLSVVDFDNKRTKEDHYLEVHVGDVDVL